MTFQLPMQQGWTLPVMNLRFNYALIMVVSLFAVNANGAPMAYSINSDGTNSLYRIDLATGVEELRGKVTTGITGFEPYGPWQQNPSAQVAKSLDGQRIGDFRIVSAELPVVMDGLSEQVERLLARVQPEIVLSNYARLVSVLSCKMTIRHSTHTDNRTATCQYSEMLPFMSLIPKWVTRSMTRAVELVDF